MKNTYRLNVRFDCSDATQKELVKKLKAIDWLRHGSINSFVLAAIREHFENAERTQTLAETLRQVLREELQSIALAAPTQSIATEAPDSADEVSAVMETLSMFD